MESDYNSMELCKLTEFAMVFSCQTLHDHVAIFFLCASPGADMGLYVPKLQGPRDVLARLKSEISHRDSDGVYLFTGQIGSGKSTGPECKVYYPRFLS